MSKSELCPVGITKEWLDNGGFGCVADWRVEWLGSHYGSNSVWTLDYSMYSITVIKHTGI